MKLLLLRAAGLLLVSLLAVKAAQSQPFNLDDRIVPVELKLEEYHRAGKDKPNGRLARLVTTQETDTAYYFVKGLSMYSPTYFSINALNKSADLKVNLCQENWHQFHQGTELTGTKIWSTKFKTEDGFGIMVVAKKKPVRYILLAWTGKELEITLPSVFKGAETAAGSGFTDWLKRNRVLTALAVLAVVIISILFIRLKRKKS